MINYLRLFLMMNFPCIVFAQYTIEGTVMDSISGKALPGASVTVLKTFVAAITDNNGKFILKNVRSGRQLIKASYIGYETREKEIELTSNSSIDFYLLKSPVLADEVLITATRADEKSGIAFSNLYKEDIEKRNFVQDVPYILSMTPSAVITSDAGNGVGYTGIRIRGSDATRINITINGIPINDAESQQLYWVDLPDIISSVDNVQIQRGVGTSTNGAGAFGGSINIQINRLRTEPYLESNHAAGSFGTVKNNILFGTGLLGNHWVFDARLSKINSDGYVDRAASDLKSIYVSQGYYSKKSIIRLNIFSGKEITYQSWYGTPESRINNDIQEMKDFVIRNGLDTEDSLNLLNSGRTYNFYTYQNQVDDYQQDNYQLHFSQQFSEQFTFNTSLHFTRGRGFFEEYKKKNDVYGEGMFSFYGLPDVIIGNDTITATNFIRRKWLDNDFYGTVFSLNYESFHKIKANLGGGWNKYDGDHFDELIYAQVAPFSSVPYRYDFNNGLKTDFNIYGKMMFDISNKAGLFADVQFRKVKYNFSGFDNSLNNVPQTVTLDFFNPKMGFNFTINNEQSAYVFAGIGNKEPSRDDFVATSPVSRPKPENMQDIECGYRLKKNKFSAGINLYFMNYKDQLVLTGQVNDVGNYTRTNIDKSYRAGVEGEIEWRMLKKIFLKANATYCQNKIKNYNQYVDDYDAGVQVVKNYKNTDIAFSPNWIAAGEINYEPVKNLTFDFITKYVGKQYLDNTSDEAKKLKAYSVSDVRIGYKIKSRLIKEIAFGIIINNIFNHLYESNGYTYSYIYGGTKTVENFYYPQAGTSIFGRLSLKF